LPWVGPLSGPTSPRPSGAVLLLHLSARFRPRCRCWRRWTTSARRWSLRASRFAWSSRQRRRRSWSRRSSPRRRRRTEPISPAAPLPRPVRAGDVRAGLPLAGAALLVAAVSALLAGWLPLGFSIVTVFLFAGPHNWLEARYFLTRLPARWGRLRGYFLFAFAG